jgi:diguanylate cyclase (GGDEF)-like protein/PAS domain S-box-containing protein
LRANHLSAEQEPRRAAAIAPAAEPDPELARVVRLAARVVRAPIAVLAMFDEGELQLISWPGLATALTPMVASFLRELSSAELSFLELDPWQLPAAHTCRFAAGVPLGDEGAGVLCVFDHQRRRLSPEERRDLVEVGALAARQLALRREAAQRIDGEAAAMAELGRLASVIESLPFNFWICDSDGRYLLQSAIARQGWGDHVGLLPEETTAPPELRAYWAATNRRVLAGETVRGEISYTLDNRVVHTEEILAPARDPHGEIWGLIGVNLDIGARKRAEMLLKESEARLRAAIESLPFDFWICDAAGRYIMNNSTSREHWGSHVGKLPGESDVDPVVARAWAETNEQVLSGQTLRYEAVYGDGNRRREVEAILAPVVVDGRIIGLVGVNIDITERKRAEERMRHLADHDALTGLPNRRKLQEQLGRAISRNRRRGETAALLLLDLDALKGINDAFGHDAGDALLCEVAARLRLGRREEDLVARLGGDEFAVILENLRRPSDAGVIADRVLAALRQPFLHGGQELTARGSIGIAVHPGDSLSASDLLKQADIALYRAKQAGRGGFQFFEPRMRVEIDHRRSLETELRRALERAEFTLFYQPIVDLACPGCPSFEALLRWEHPERGLLLPGEFLQLAEETGLVVPIGGCVLEMAAQQARRWADAEIEVGRIAINVASAQFATGDLDSIVADALATYRLPAECLEIEVTEGVFLGPNAGLAEELLHRLHRRGVSIVLDDFGTGHASLTHLRRFPINKLKIDRSFIRDMLDDADDAAIVRAIINLGHSLGLEIVAEGVETEAQLALLRRYGCEHVQGYLLSPPTPAAQALQRIGHDPWWAGTPAEAGESGPDANWLNRMTSASYRAASGTG